MGLRSMTVYMYESKSASGELKYGLIRELMGSGVNVGLGGMLSTECHSSVGLFVSCYDSITTKLG